MNIGGIDMEEL